MRRQLRSKQQPVKEKDTKSGAVSRKSPAVGVHTSIAEKVKEKERGKKQHAGGSSKLNALVNKLVESAAQGGSNSSSKPGTPDVSAERSRKKPPSKAVAVAAVAENEAADEEM